MLISLGCRFWTELSSSEFERRDEHLQLATTTAAKAGNRELPKHSVGETNVAFGAHSALSHTESLAKDRFRYL